jgi:hypothetical protein
LLAVACTGGPSATQLLTWPVDEETLAVPATWPVEPTAVCGSRPFPVRAFSAEAGAEMRTGPSFDALRSTLDSMAEAFPDSDSWSWVEAATDATGAVFIARSGGESPDWFYVEVTADARGWHQGPMGTCEPHLVLGAEYGPAGWALNADHPRPDSTTTDLHLLVWERACSGGSPATGRMSPPAILYDTATVTIAIGVRPLRSDGPVTCPGPPGTPALVRLSEPLGERSLLDGGRVPPAEPRSLPGGHAVGP